MNRPISIKYLGAGILAVSLLFATEKNLAQPADSSFKKSETPLHSDQPNIIVILADDLGYGRFSRLFWREGKNATYKPVGAWRNAVCRIFTVTARCVHPTRAALLTGRYQQRLGIERAFPTDWNDKGIVGEENSSEITLARIPRGWRV